jgi:hypothetical protein
LTQKVVQTELPEEEYALLKKTAKEKNLSIKDGVREAVRQWIETKIPLGEDSLFQLRPVKTGVRSDSSRLDEEIYGEPQPHRAPDTHARNI